MRALACCILLAASSCALERPIGGGVLPSAAQSGGRSGTVALPSGGNAAASGARSQLNPELILASGCAQTTKIAPLLPANILFVLDRSGSMACNPPPTTDSASCEANPVRADPTQASKWEITSNALLVALQSLPEDTVVAVSYFSDDDACGVYSIPNVLEAANTVAQRKTIAASLASIVPNGPTPLVGATILAYRYMHDAALRGAMTGRQYVVLITDGAQSDACSDPPLCAGAQACTDLLVNQEVPRALAPGVDIRTFVIGAPGSEGSRTVLSRIAMNGGTALPNCNPDLGNCHFDMTREADLSAGLQRALQDIAGQTLTCDLEIPKPDAGVVDRSLVNVVFTPHDAPAFVVPQDNHAPCDSGADGWQYNPSNDQIRLCGNTCNMVRGNRGGSIVVVLGCPVITPN